MSIYAQVYDSNGAYALYDFSISVQVIPDNMSNITTLVDLIVSTNISTSLNILLNDASSKGLDALQEIQQICGLLNEKSLESKLGLMRSSNKVFPQVYGPLASYNGVLPVKFNYFQKEIRVLI